MKIKNIKFSAFAYYSNGTVKHRFFASEKAKDNWCNKQGSKDINTLVEIYDFETDNLVETWRA